MVFLVLESSPSLSGQHTFDRNHEEIIIRNLAKLKITNYHIGKEMDTVITFLFKN